MFDLIMAGWGNSGYDDPVTSHMPWSPSRKKKKPKVKKNPVPKAKAKKKH